MKRTLLLFKGIVRYRFAILVKKMAVKFLSETKHKDLNSLPKVTLFISSLNTRYPLELTLKSLLENTSYPNLNLLIADNASNDGSLEYLESLNLKEYSIDLIKSPRKRLHSEWLDEVFKTVKTPYWIAVDSDMLFLGKDWLVDMIKIMEDDPNIYVLGAEKVKEKIISEPISGEIIEADEHLSTWLFCIRTSLRDHIETSFTFVNLGKNGKTGRTKVCDTGGKLLMDMRGRNLIYQYMPLWFTHKYYHFGGMSWLSKDSKELYSKFKAYQLNHIKKMIKSKFYADI